MSGQAPTGLPAPPSGRRLRLTSRVLVSVLATIAVAVVGMLVWGWLDVARPKPDFPSLADHPDSSLQGTVAYFADSSRCVRIVAAAGRPAKDVLCLTDQDVPEAMKLGKEIGPQLVWRPGGRLEVTMFRMTDPPGPTFRAGWQKIVDVRTGAVTQVPAADVPSEANLLTRSTVSPSGQQIDTTSDNGSIEVALHDASGSRTLLSAQGPGEYTYGLISAFWAADFQWIAADDGRILVITTADPSTTRVLTDESTNVTFGGDDPRLARFAVTAEDILSVTG